MTQTMDQLKSKGWSAISSTIPRRAILDIEGLDKTGKSHLALQAPPPIAYLDLDVGTEGVIQKFSDKEIILYQPNTPLNEVGDVKEKWWPIWEEVRDKYYQGLQMGEGTVIVDTMGEMYDVARLAYFGKLSQVQPHNYNEVYAPLREMVRAAYKSKMNVIFLHKLGDKFGSDNELEMKGFKEMPFLVQCTIRTSRTNTDDGPLFSAQVITCRHDPTQMGKWLMVNMPVTAKLPYFEMLLTMIHGGA